MKKWIIFAVVLSCLMAVPAMAVDLKSLDKVTMLMSNSEVKALIGEPTRKNEVVEGLDAELYLMDNTSPLSGVACIYNDQDKLVALAMMIDGYVGEVTAERLMKQGFVPRKAAEGIVLLFGLEDDTKRPVAVTVSEHDNLTTVITYDQEYYLSQNK